MCENEFWERFLLQAFSNIPFNTMGVLYSEFSEKDGVRGGGVREGHCLFSENCFCRFVLLSYSGSFGKQESKRLGTVKIGCSHVSE